MFSALFESLFDAGNLTHDGSNAGSFADHFHTSGEAVSLLGTDLPPPPEPPEPEDALTLWYQQPASDWETQALPIGNGRLGGSTTKTGYPSRAVT